MIYRLQNVIQIYIIVIPANDILSINFFEATAF